MSHRFGLLIGSPKIGGAERQARALARALQERDRFAAVYFLERAGRRPRSACLDFADVPNRFVGHGKLRSWWSRPRLRRYVAEDRLDCLVAFNVEAMEFAISVLRPGSTTLLGSVRGLGFDGSPELTRRLAACAEQVDLVTCNSIAIERALIENGIAESRRVQILPNIIDLPPSPPPIATNGLRTLLFVGNLIEVKRPELFVRACRLVMERLPDVRAVIVGDGALMGAVRDAAAADIERFEFCRHLPPDRVPYARASLVVSTSRREGSSNALLEAMANARPVVASRAGGNQDLIQRSGAGVLVDSERPEDYANAIVELLSSDEALRKCAGAGRRFVQEHHSAQRSVDLLIRFATEWRRSGADG